MTDRDAKIERALATLLAAFPLAFPAEPQQIKPLAVGIRQQIYARCTLSHRDVIDALRRYTGRTAYLRTIIEGAARVDLDGATSSTVTAKEAAYAAERIAKDQASAAGKPKAVKKDATKDATKDVIKVTSKSRASAKVSLPQAPVAPDISKPGPRRLSLADLRQAAAARKAPASKARAAAKD
jgi:ProP effector